MLSQDGRVVLVEFEEVQHCAGGKDGWAGNQARAKGGARIALAKGRICAGNGTYCSPLATYELLKYYFLLGRRSDMAWGYYDFFLYASRFAQLRKISYPCLSVKLGVLRNHKALLVRWTWLQMIFEYRRLTQVGSIGGE